MRWAVLFALLLAACAPRGGASKKKASPSSCAQCHSSEFTAAPNHVGQRPTTCGVCHASTAWKPQHLDHPYWPLTGAHAKARCFGCHTSDPPVFRGTPKECSRCHQADFKRSKFPRHETFTAECSACHSVDAWKPALPNAPIPRTAPVPKGSSTTREEPDTVSEASGRSHKKGKRKR